MHNRPPLGLWEKVYSWSKLGSLVLSTSSQTDGFTNWWRTNWFKIWNLLNKKKNILFSSQRIKPDFSRKPSLLCHHLFHIQIILDKILSQLEHFSIFCLIFCTFSFPYPSSVVHLITYIEIFLLCLKITCLSQPPPENSSLLTLQRVPLPVF